MISRVLFVCLYLLLLVQIGSAQQVEWNKNFKEASQKARETGKPMLIDFWATWCKPCKMMETSFWPREEVVAASQKFVCVKLDLDSERDLARRYGV